MVNIEAPLPTWSCHTGTVAIFTFMACLKIGRVLLNVRILPPNPRGGDNTEKILPSALRASGNISPYSHLLTFTSLRALRPACIFYVVKSFLSTHPASLNLDGTALCNYMQRLKPSYFGSNSNQNDNCGSDYIREPNTRSHET